ncbi:hypothetical protein GCM10028818_01120 [Spirosoma horti]
MNLQTQIRQQQSSVQMLEKLVKARRASQAELDRAKSRLADLQGHENFVPLPERAQRVDQPAAQPPKNLPSGPTLSGDNIARMQADLSKEADTLNRQMAGLSNQLHQVPQNVPCPHLTKPILALKAQIEAIWDKKRYLERNRALPAEPTQEPDYLPDLVSDDAGKFELAHVKRSLIDKRSKLRRKLTDPKSRPSKRQEWETDLAICEQKIQEIEFKLS